MKKIISKSFLLAFLLSCEAFAGGEKDGVPPEPTKNQEGTPPPSSDAASSPGHSGLDTLYGMDSPPPQQGGSVNKDEHQDKRAREKKAQAEKDRQYTKDIQKAQEELYKKFKNTLETVKQEIQKSLIGDISPLDKLSSQKASALGENYARYLLGVIPKEAINYLYSDVGNSEPSEQGRLLLEEGNKPLKTRRTFFPLPEIEVSKDLLDLLPKQVFEDFKKELRAKYENLVTTINPFGELPDNADLEMVIRSIRSTGEKAEEIFQEMFTRALKEALDIDLAERALAKQAAEEQEYGKKVQQAEKELYEQFKNTLKTGLQEIEDGISQGIFPADKISNKKASQFALKYAEDLLKGIPIAAMHRLYSDTLNGLAGGALEQEVKQELERISQMFSEQGFNIPVPKIELPKDFLAPPSKPLSSESEQELQTQYERLLTTIDPYKGLPDDYTMVMVIKSIVSTGEKAKKIFEEMFKKVVKEVLDVDLLESPKSGTRPREQAAEE